MSLLASERAISKTTFYKIWFSLFAKSEGLLPLVILKVANDGANDDGAYDGVCAA